MTIFQSPLTALPLLAALLLSVCGASLKRGHILSFLGGLCWAAGTVSALVEGAALAEVLIVTLALLLATTGFWRGAGR